MKDYEQIRVLKFRRGKQVMDQLTDFTVCVLAKETPEIVDRFCQYYLAAGAASVQLYLDRGAEPTKKIEDSRLTVITCDEMLSDLGLEERPEFIADVQGLVYRHAYERLTTAWMLICDIDEYVYAKGGISQSLAHVPVDWQFVQLSVAEAVWSAQDDLHKPFGSSLFRMRAPEGVGKLQSVLVHGSHYKFLIAGLVGHSIGKYFVRSGLKNLDMGIHEVFRPSDPLTGGRPEQLPGAKTLLLHHFDAINFERWNMKQQGRVDRSRASRTHNFNAATDRMFEHFKSCNTLEERKALFQSLYQVNSRQAALLRLFGRLRKTEIFDSR